MSEVNLADLALYARYMEPGNSPEEDRDERMGFAMELLNKLPVIKTADHDGVVLETRLIGQRVESDTPKNKKDAALLNVVQGLLADLLTTEESSPAYGYDPESRQVTITHRQSLVQ